MMTTMTKDELLARMEEGRGEWDRLLVEVGQDRLGEPLDPDDADGWTTRDLIGHVMTTERSLMEVIRASIGGSEPPSPDLFGNALSSSGDGLHVLDHTMPLARLLRTAEEVFDDLLAVVQDVPDERIVDPAAFSWTSGVALVDLVAQHTVEHYQQHDPALRQFILAGEGLEGNPDDPVEL